MSFRKGDLVTMLSDWDSKGSVSVRDLVVHSCGRKQMVLVDGTGAKFQGAFFDPSGSMFRTRVVPRLSVADAEAAGLAFAAGVVFARWQARKLSMVERRRARQVATARHVRRMVRIRA